AGGRTGGAQHHLLRMENRLNPGWSWVAIGAPWWRPCLSALDANGRAAISRSPRLMCDGLQNESAIAYGMGTISPYAGIRARRLQNTHSSLRFVRRLTSSRVPHHSLP